VDAEPVVVTKFYLFQQSQHQHLLMIWKNDEENDEENDEKKWWRKWWNERRINKPHSGICHSFGLLQ
jgi:hypothetical protein